MTALCGRSLTMAARALACASLFVACKNSTKGERGRHSPPQPAGNASTSDAAPAQDPCTLLSANEAEPYVGALEIAPFRASDGSDMPDVAGEECVYRGVDARHLTVLADWRGGGAMSKVLQDIPTGTNADETTGPWDKVTWTPGRALFVSMGDAQIRIDMSATRGGENDALAMAREIIPRVGHPLSPARSLTRSK
jgi:hypothetical protein